MRTLLCWLLLSTVALGYEKPVLLIIKSPTCGPCKVFDNVYRIDEEVRFALNKAFVLRQLDLGVPSQRLEAERLGVDCVPTFLVMRDGKRVSSHVGFATTMNVQAVNKALADLMDDLAVEWPPSREEPVPAQKPPIDVGPKLPPPVQQQGPQIDQIARERIDRLSVQQDLIRREVSEVRSSVTESSAELKAQLDRDAQRTKEQLDGITKAIHGATGLTQTPPVVPSTKPEEIVEPENTPGPTASKWLKLFAWVAKTGVAVAAPEIAIPGSIGLGVLGFGLRWLLKKKEPQPLGSQSNPIMIHNPGDVKTETKWVVSETDLLGEAYREAARRLGNTHRETSPQIVEVLQQLDAVASQLAHGKRIARRPSIVPVSEDSPRGT